MPSKSAPTLPTARSAPKKKKPLLKPGEIVITKNRVQYEVEQKLGEGGFGEVYKVWSRREPEKRYALKVEQNKTEAGMKFMLKLKCEAHVYKKIEESNGEFVDKSHFIHLIDKGTTVDFKFYLMDLTWLPLKDVIEKVLGGKTRPHTKMAIARQSLVAIENLHKIGYIHRDIKWHNFAVGLPPKDHIIYLLDFGIARPYLDQKFVPLPPRTKVRFLGTVKYATMAALENQDQGRKHDLEMWLYMMMEVYDKKNITWEDNREDALRKKKEIFGDPRDLFRTGKLKMPLKYMEIIVDIGKLTFSSKGCFKAIYANLDDIVKIEQINVKLPLDWVGKKAKSPERKKKPPIELSTMKQAEEEMEDDTSSPKHRLIRDPKIGKPSLEVEKSEDEESSEDYSDQFEAFVEWQRRRKASKRKSKKPKKGVDKRAKNDKGRKFDKNKHFTLATTTEVNTRYNDEKTVDATREETVELKEDKKTVLTREDKKTVEVLVEKLQCMLNETTVDPTEKEKKDKETTKKDPPYSRRSK